MVEKHYRSVLSKGVLDPFFAAHTKVLPTHPHHSHHHPHPPPLDYFNVSTPTLGDITTALSDSLTRSLCPRGVRSCSLFHPHRIPFTPLLAPIHPSCVPWMHRKHDDLRGGGGGGGAPLGLPRRVLSWRVLMPMLMLMHAIPAGNVPRGG